MKAYPKVSIIVTIYNREKYVEKCARSLFEQTLDHIEYLFIDDASTDNSIPVLESVIEEYPKRKPFVRVIKQSVNGGRAVARQIGIEHASGEYIIHVDSDDWVDKNMMELLYLKAKETDADIVGCNITHEYATYQRIFHQQYFSSMDDNIKGLLSGALFPSLCTSLTRASLIRDYHIDFPRNIDTGEDLLFNINLFLHAHRAVGIASPSYHYRHTEDSGSYKHTDRSIKSVIEVARRIEELMKETGNYEKFKDDIQFRKFSMKCALITNFDNKDNNHAWLRLFPETHPFIWSYKQFSWKRRVEFWFAAHNMFFAARLFQKMLRYQHRLRHPLSLSSKLANFMMICRIL